MTTADFWIERWRSGQTGWHQPEGNAALRAFWPSLNIAPDARVLVPFCGKSPDLAWLHEQGHTVVGVELCADAIEQFLAEAGLDNATVSDVEQWRIYETDRLRLIAGDWFTVPTEVVGPIDAFYDRAALIACAPEQRQPYVAQINRLCGPDAKGLLVTLEHSGASGPPFSVPEALLRDLYEGDWQVALLDRRSVDNVPPALAELGPAYECAYRLERR
ncbi:MAG: thiopurine S-methyltransferase [Candidatus Dadabacteria bacterium]|nr:MAG: thiopurine S-methyltransferase [Candidatus Dadabacteria bacterium]